jgi:hypothetical protein
MPYSPELGANHQTKHIQKRTATGPADSDI